MTNKFFNCDLGYSALLAARVKSRAQVVQLVTGQNFVKFLPKSFDAAERKLGNAFQIGFKHRRYRYALIFDFVIFALAVNRDYEIALDTRRFILIRSHSRFSAFVLPD